MAGGSRKALRTGGALVAVGLALAPAASGASAERGRGQVTRQLALGTPVHLTVTLWPRDPAALSAYAREVSTPGAAVYHRFLSPSQFAQRFGASRTAIATVRRALAARGLGPGRVAVDRLSISLVAPAARLEHGLRLSLRRVGHGPRAAIAASTTPSLGQAAGHSVQAIIGLDSASAPQPLLVRPSRHGGLLRPADRVRAQPAAGRSHVVTGGPQPCAEARSGAAGQGAYTADQLASAYGFPGLYHAKNSGAGITVAVYELESVSASDLATFQSCYHTHAPISYVRVDGGAGSGPGSGEAALDIENLLSFAPATHLLVYQGPNSNSGAPGAGPYDIFRTIINQDRAQVVSVSWGECEALLGAADAAGENTLFQQAAVQGQTIVAAAGDTGSEDCNGATGTPQTQLAVDDPASQPFVTGVGGTQLTSLGPRPRETVWNDGGAGAGVVFAGAAGGGISSLWTMPTPQRQASASLDVLGADSTGSTCGRRTGYCRQVPDVSANADPSTGYEIYYNGSGRVADQPSGWQAVGGTSAAAPLWAALLALTDASRACASSRVGYALPSLYRAAGSSYGSIFNDVRSGNNDLTGTNGGRFAARVAYDEASGLGSPNAAALAQRLCASTLRLASLGTQRSGRHATVSLRLRYFDVPGAGVVLHVRGLPAGLRFHPATERVTGSLRHTGISHVTVFAHDAQGSRARERFTWSVGGPTRVLAASVSGLRTRRVRLAFAVAAGRGAPALRELILTLPVGLRLRSTRGVGLSARGRRARFRARSQHGRLVIDLRRAAGRVLVTLGSRAVSRSAGAGAHSPVRSVLSVIAVDARGGSSLVRARVRRR
ncbi:MAG: S53 family peptidase [Actinomycetota bacterium]|nr:S53 family peptidase [Actinomycetota bacterium]